VKVKEPVFKSLQQAATYWNETGRAYYAEYSRRLGVYYGDGDQSIDLDMNDPRSEALGKRVMAAVIDYNQKGQWQRAREQFDPAYSPLFPLIKKSDCHLGFVAILGPDELLVKNGAAWKTDGVTYHLKGGDKTIVPDVRGLHRSRNRNHLVLARGKALEIHDARTAAANKFAQPVATIPWPDLSIFRPEGMNEGQAADWQALDDDDLQIEQLGMSDDGMRIVVSCYRQGILLASRHPGEPAWQLVMPDGRDPYWWDNGVAPSAGDMTHVAISPDGKRLAWGDQSSPHFVAEIADDGVPAWYATVGNRSEYPHYACFSDDGRYVALNSCHFYNGSTISFDCQGNRGVKLEAYEDHPQAPCIDGSLRVYAATWVGKPVLEAAYGKPVRNPGGFVLAGNGIFRIVGATSGLASVQGFGSSASAIDYCHESNRLALTSFSGFVHLYDPLADELPGRIDGMRPRREIARWAMWDHLPHGPVRW
jgi:hypothetical protein